MAWGEMRGAPPPDPIESYDSRPDTYAHIQSVQAKLLGVAIDLIRRAHNHDASKLVKPEVEIFDEYTPKLREMTYGSDEYKEALAEMTEKGLGHHYRENDHHPEHFENGIHDMGLVELIEMFCDWWAATERHNDGNLHESIEKNAERFGYGSELKRILSNTIGSVEITDDTYWEI